MYVLSKTLHNAYIEHMIGFQMCSYVCFIAKCMYVYFFLYQEETNKQTITTTRFRWRDDTNDVYILQPVSNLPSIYLLNS